MLKTQTDCLNKAQQLSAAGSVCLEHCGLGRLIFAISPIYAVEVELDEFMSICHTVHTIPPNFHVTDQTE